MDNTLIETQYTNYHLLICKNRPEWFKAKSPLKLDLDPNIPESKIGCSRHAEGKLNIPKPRTNYLKNSFSYTGAVLWNSLPAGLRQAKTLESFKAGLR